MHQFALFLSVFMLSTAPVLVKFLTLEPLIILIWRLLFVSVLLLPFAYKHLKSLTFSSVKQVLLVSAVLTIHFLLWFKGIPMLNVSVIAVIFASNPIFTAILGYFILSEPFKKRYFVAITMSIIGIYYAFLSQSKAEVNVVGISYILGASSLYSLYMVLSKRCRKEMNNGLYTFTLNFGALILGLLVFIFTTVITDLEVVTLINVDMFSFQMLFLLALMPSVLGHTLMIYSIPFFNLNFISCLKLLSPLSASALGIYFFGDQLSKELIIGFILVSAGVLFAIPWKFKTKKELQK
jgi:drug/metabolite transporter (DMT)-like permease